MVLRFQDAESCPRDWLGCSPALEPLQRDVSESRLIFQPIPVFLGLNQCLPSAITVEQLQCCGVMYPYIWCYKSCS